MWFYPGRGIDRLLSWMLTVSCVVDWLHYFLLLFLSTGLTTPTKNWGRASFTSHTPAGCGLWNRLVPKLPRPYILLYVTIFYTWTILSYSVCVYIYSSFPWYSVCSKSCQWAISGCLQIELCMVSVIMTLSSASLSSYCHTKFSREEYAVSSFAGQTLKQRG